VQREVVLRNDSNDEIYASYGWEVGIWISNHENSYSIMTKVAGAYGLGETMIVL
jgi:hypothetical protein